MSKQLDELITAYLAPDKKMSLAQALDKVENLDELVAAVHERSSELIAKDAKDLSDEDKTNIGACTEILFAAAEKRNAAAEAAKQAAQAAESQDKLASLLTQPAEPKNEPDPQDTAAVEKAAPTVTDTPAPQTVPAVEPVIVEAPKELVGAGAPAAFSVASLPGTPAAQMANKAQEVKVPLTSTFAVDSSGVITDRKFDNVTDIGNQIMGQLQSYSGSIPGLGLQRNGVAAFRRGNLEDFMVNRPEDAPAVIERVVARQPTWDDKAKEWRSGSQFAAGWCAPSESLYELCPYVTSMDGMVDIPEVVANRGGVRYTSGPNFATLFANSAIGQVLTEANVIAAQVKTCIEIDCPPFTEVRLDVNPLCITGNLLTLAGYPEYVERFIRESIAANAHKINLNVLTRMVAASTAVTIPAVPATTGVVDTSSASEFLDFASLYAVWLRDRYRLRQDALIEVVAPYWYFQHMTADLARRNGVDLLTSASRLREAFAERNIRIQWVYDWQPVAATAAGAATRPLAAQVLIFIPGTFVKLTSPVINLDRKSVV